jgi:hypothetical protein
VIRLLQRILCALGWHHEEPVSATRAKGAYVLLRCTRCERDHALIGMQAERWIVRYLQG